MRAIGIRQPGGTEVLEEITADRPSPGARDLIVEVRGISVNPVDTKIRTRPVENGPKILGYDAAGVVVETGSDVTLFRPGDEVWYAGDATRPGTNAEFHAVDERIVGRKPASLDFAEAAGLPLTAITAWEMLFDCLRVPEGGGEGGSILIVGGAGGVGSILTQLARKLTKLTVIATASREDTVAWCERMGAHHVVNHHEDLVAAMKEIGAQPRYVASLTHTGQHIDAIRDLIAPRGTIALIDDPEGGIDIMPLKQKSLTVAWEFMFARPIFGTDDMDEQGKLLNRVADMIDDGTLVSTVNRDDGPLTVEALREAHAFQESGKAIGKTVMAGLGG